MKAILLLSSLSLLLAACGGNNEKDAVEKAVDKTKDVVKENTEETAKTAVANTTGSIDKKAAVAEAKTITKAFGSALKAELKAAMKAGGAINALEVCNTKATPIAETVAKEHSAMISRVSLKNRNPDNVPNDWQKAVLENFDARAAKGEDVKKMGFAEIVEQDGKKKLRFMKALPTGGLCLDCHGSEIDVDVQAKLSELYPEDKATGYAKGQVRGAVVVIKDLN